MSRTLSRRVQNERGWMIMGDWRGRTDGRRCQFVSRYRLEKCLKLPPPPPHRGRPSCSSRLETLPRRTRPQSPPIEIGGRCTRTRVRIGREGGREGDRQSIVVISVLFVAPPPPPPFIPTADHLIIRVWRGRRCDTKLARYVGRGNRQNEPDHRHFVGEGGIL